MTFLFNDPASFAEDALTGFCELHADLVRQVPGGAVRRTQPAQPKVAVLPGGGSGHYPAFYGIIGPGLADGAVSGNLFTSPSAQDAYSVALAADSGAGVVFSYGNYAGDVMNFGLATERLRREGIDADNVIVTDDIASASPEQTATRRGIAGDFTVFKVMSAAAEEGMDLAGVVRVGRKANDRTRTIGAAFTGCTFPGADAPLFTIPDGQMGLGLGIHGEPGLRDVTRPAARELAEDFVRRLLAEKPAGAGDRVALILNGLGAVKQEELFVLWSSVAALLRESGHVPVLPEVGELVTSLDMAAVSLTFTWLDDELARLWTAPAWTPAFRRGRIAEHTVAGRLPEPATAVEQPAATRFAPASAESRELAATLVDAARVVQRALHDAEADLGEIDAVAGDGDHGRGMVRGVDAAVAGMSEAYAAGAGAGECLAAAGDAWADRAGGTSGVLWGAGLRAAGEAIGNDDGPAGADAAVSAFTERVIALGGAQQGDKTLVDALLPFRDALHAAVRDGIPLAAGWVQAAALTDKAAQQTASLTPRKGRARPLADRSVGTPDAGAVSLALIVRVLGHYLEGEGR